MRKSHKTKKEAELFEASAAKNELMIANVFPTLARDIWGGSKDERNVLRIADELVVRLGPTKMIHKIDTLDIEKLTKDLRAEGNQPRTINTKLTRLSKLLKKSRRLHMIERVPDIDLLKVEGGRIRFLNYLEEESIRFALPDEYKGLFDFLLYTGARYGEAHRLTWADVSDTHATFWVTKGGKARTIPLANKARASINWNLHNSQSGPFAHVNYHQFRNAFIKAKGLAKLGEDKQVVIHVLRHTCASRLVQRGIDIRRVKDWMGHATLDQTLKYAHLAPKDLDIAAQALNG